MTGRNHDDSRLDALMAEMAKLRAEVTALRAGEPRSPQRGHGGPGVADTEIGRRAMLGKIGAVAAGGAGLLVGGTVLASPADAATSPVELGQSNNAGSALTTITSTSNGAAIEGANTGTGSGVYGVINGGSGLATAAGVVGDAGRGTDSAAGVAGYSSETDGYGVYGSASEGCGVYGTGNYTGVQGVSDSGFGLYGSSNSGIGVFATSGSGSGVSGSSGSGSGVSGQSGTDGMGVYGVAGTPSHTAVAAAVVGDTSADNINAVAGFTTGKQCSAIAGYATGDSSNGVTGSSTNGVGLLGSSSNGQALLVDGVAAFARSGTATVAGTAAKPAQSVVVNQSNLSSSSLVLATIQGAVAGVAVEGVVVSPANSELTITLTKKVKVSVTVAWFVIN